MPKNSKIITSNQFLWSQNPIANQLIYTITTAEDSIIAGGQFLSAAKVDKDSGELLWSHPGTAFRTTEIISDSSGIKTGGQYNSYAWEQLDNKGISLSTIPKYTPTVSGVYGDDEVYGHKAFVDKKDFWEIYSTTPNGIWAEYFEFHVRKNNSLLTTNTANNFNPLAIAYDKDNLELYLAGWEGFEQHQVQIYKFKLNTSLPTLNLLPAATITSSNLVKGDQLVINEMIWDQREKKLVFVGDAHSGSTSLDDGILGSYEPGRGLSITYHPFKGFIGDGSAESFQTLDEISKDYYLVGGSDSSSPNSTLGKLMLAKKADLSIKETISIDIQSTKFDHIKDVVLDENSIIYMGGSGGVHKLGKDTEIFDIATENHEIQKPKVFNKKYADKITNFNPSTDTLEINTDSFGIDSSATFAAGKNKKAVKKELAKQDFDFLYDQKKGGLYFNENGADKGFGDGGIIAILKGAPELTSSNLIFI